jgi:DCN1-like protein 1/2
VLKRKLIRTPENTGSEDDEITVDGTIKLCEDLAVNPEDVVMLAVAYELKSPRVGQWTRKGWHDGWKNLGFVLVSDHLRGCLWQC